MSPTIRGALKHAVFLGFVSVVLLSAAALGGDGCLPAAAASQDHQAYDTPSSDRETAATFSGGPSTVITPLGEMTMVAGTGPLAAATMRTVFGGR